MLQYSCLENSMERSLAGYSPWGRKELDSTEHTHTKPTASFIAGRHLLSWFWRMLVAVAWIHFTSPGSCSPPGFS